MASNHSLLIFSLALALFAPHAVSAQTPPLPDGSEAAAASDEAVVEFLLRRLYAGVTVDEAMRRAVRAVVLKSLVDQRAVSNDLPDVMDRRYAIIDRRNRELRALLRSDEDRRRFDRNLALLR